ncbi:FAD-binding domain-containing protein [Dendrothele bispora CBS 962.96]|uniref:FAD-binding domain-containing protein n=1 Tax=Dendrothele bispora (strain CBS 962.96) TaxID=1314807 RepID=A0A4S8LH76_DENBC|nr:FAD-binding domain-containing protein [Dendrothele bispora CBS 962.96]
MKTIHPRKPRLLLYGLACFLPRASSRQTSTTSNATLACNQAQSILGNSINLSNTQFEPACVVLPRNSTDFQVAMLAAFYISIRCELHGSGGEHSEGVERDGILISFERMDNISYEAAKDTITFEPAIRWGEIVAALESQGVSSRGRIDDVGTDLLLGRGLSFLSPVHGFAADNYVELDIVLVDGTLVTATETNNYSDLFRALKGGANRFAIHTGTANEKTWFDGTYSNSSFDAVAQAVSHYVRDVEDPNAALLLYFGALVLADGTLTSFSIADIGGGDSPPPSIFRSLATSMAEPQPANGHGQLFGASFLAAGEDHDDLSFIDSIHKWQNSTFTFRSQINSTNAIDPSLVPNSTIRFQLMFPLGHPVPPGFPLFMNECDVKQSVFITYGQYEFLKQTYMKYDPTRCNLSDWRPFRIE